MTAFGDSTGWRLEMGATTLDAGGVRFRVWAPAASRVEVELLDAAGQPAGPRYVPLEPEGDGVWSGTLADAGPGTRYRYRLNQQHSFPDPYSRSQPEGVHGPSEVIDPQAFAWGDQAWPGLGIQHLVIYQCHVGTATRAGTFDGLIELLPQLSDLGIGAIQPLPLAEFPGTRNWGYDGVDLFAPAHVYGGPDGLKRLIDAAHQHGLGVILDVVYNHLGPDGNYLRQFAPDYFTDRYQTPWGEAVNYDGPGSRWVRQLVLDNARAWLHEYHADGLRLDATHAIHDASEPHILAELSQAVRTSLGPHRPVVLIAETSDNDVRYLAPVEQGGFGLDAVYADDFHHTLRRYLAGDHEGYYAEYTGSLDEVARCIQQGWLYQGQPTRRSGRPRGTPAGDYPAWNFVYTIQNHDQIGNRAFGERLNHQVELDRYLAASLLLLFLPYTPLLFMGQEFAASAPFQYFTDHHPELGRLVTEGRRREFAAFSAFADPARREQIPDPQALSTFVNSTLDWAEAERAPGRDVREMYTQVIDLRRHDPVLNDQDRRQLRAQALGADVLSVLRWRDAAARLCLANFGDASAAITDFGGTWQVLVHSGPLPQVGSDRIELPPRSAAILGRDAR